MTWSMMPVINSYKLFLFFSVSFFFFFFFNKKFPTAMLVIGFDHIFTGACKKHILASCFQWFMYLFVNVKCCDLNPLSGIFINY